MLDGIDVVLDMADDADRQFEGFQSQFQQLLNLFSKRCCWIGADFVQAGQCLRLPHQFLFNILSITDVFNQAGELLFIADGHFADRQFNREG